MRRYATAVAAVAAVAAVLAAAACTDEPSPSNPTVTAGRSTTLTVLAAASLQDVFPVIARDFAAHYPGAKVRFSFGPSSGLATSIAAGAPADVFASASPAALGPVVDAGLVGDPQTFAVNTLELVVPPSNPARITTLLDLNRGGVKLAVCAAKVPCGDAAAAVMTGAHITTVPATFDVDVRAVLTKVELGEVDAGLVYVTDAKAAGSRVTGIPIPPASNVSTTYPIVVVNTAQNHPLAASFVAFVLSDNGRKALAAAGFGLP